MDPRQFDWLVNLELGVVGATLAPMVAIGAVAALITETTIMVEKVDK